MSEIIPNNIADKLGIRQATFEEILDSEDIGVVIPSTGGKEKRDQNKPRETVFSKVQMDQSTGMNAAGAGVQGENDPTSGQNIQEKNQGETASNPANSSEQAERAATKTETDTATASEIMALIKSDREEWEEKIEAAYTKGLADGEARREEYERNLTERYSFGLEKLQLLGRTLETQARHESLEIAVLIAKRIIQKEIKAEPLTLVDEIRHASENIMGREELTIRLNPDDLANLQEFAPDLKKHFPAVAHVILAGDPKLEQGDCMIESDVERINLTLDEQLNRLKTALEEDLS